MQPLPGSNCKETIINMKKIGVFKKEIIDLLGLNIAADTPIYVGDQNIEHMQNRHPAEYEKYFFRIEEIMPGRFFFL